MSKSLKQYHYFLYLPIVLICIVFILAYGRLFYATITERPGLWGSMHSYYNLSPVVYSIYCFIPVLLSIIFIFLPLLFMYKSDRINLLRSYRFFLLFLSLILAMEVFL